MVYYRLDSEGAEADKKQAYKEEEAMRRREEEEEEEEEGSTEEENDDGEDEEEGLSEQIQGLADDYEHSPQMEQFIDRVMHQTTAQREHSAHALQALQALFSRVEAPQTMEALRSALETPQVQQALEQWRHTLMSTPPPQPPQVQPSVPPFGLSRSEQSNSP
jgi:hypothetical protein